MRTQHLRFLVDYKKLSLSDIGKMSSISRQRVSQWLKSGEPIVNIGTIPLMNLSDSLGVKPGFFLDPNPEIDDEEFMLTLESALLWDKLYPNLASFLRALINGETRAQARLVEVYGLFPAASAIGNVVWREFAKFKHRIPPKRREELEILWKRQKELALI